jgi:hypothetical protein
MPNGCCEFHFWGTLRVSWRENHLAVEYPAFTAKEIKQNQNNPIRCKKEIQTHYKVSGGPEIHISHSKIFDSSVRPAEK